MMHPEHVANHPELIQAWESGLKHKDTFLIIIGKLNDTSPNVQ